MNVNLLSEFLTTMRTYKIKKLTENAFFDEKYSLKKIF